MRFSPLVSSQRSVFGRRALPVIPAMPELAGPTAHERKLIDRIIHRAGYRKTP